MREFPFSLRCTAAARGSDSTPPSRIQTGRGGSASAPRLPLLLLHVIRTVLVLVPRLRILLLTDLALLLRSRSMALLGILLDLLLDLLLRRLLRGELLQELIAASA